MINLRMTIPRILDDSNVISDTSNPTPDEKRMWRIYDKLCKYQLGSSSLTEDKADNSDTNSLSLNAELCMTDHDFSFGLVGSPHSSAYQLIPTTKHGSIVRE